MWRFLSSVSCVLTKIFACLTLQQQRCCLYLLSCQGYYKSAAPCRTDPGQAGNASIKTPTDRFQHKKAIDSSRICIYMLMGLYFNNATGQSCAALRNRQHSVVTLESDQHHNSSLSIVSSIRSTRYALTLLLNWPSFMQPAILLRQICNIRPLFYSRIRRRT